MPEFNPDQFLAQTSPQLSGGFNPDEFLAQTSEAPKPKENPHDVVPFLKAQGRGLVHMAKEAGSGLLAAAKDPGKAASDVVDSLSGSTDSDGFYHVLDPDAVYRTVRHVPIVGDAINHLSIAARGIPGYLKGGDEGQLEAVNAQDAYEEEQNAADAKHLKEHPLTDFIQKSAGVAVLPEGHIAQAGILAVDAFQKSMAQGNDVLTALKDARNTALMVGMAKITGEVASAIPRTLGKYAAKEAGVGPKAISRYMEDPEAVNAASKYAADPEALKNLVDERVAPVNQAVDSAQNAFSGAKEAVADTRQVPISIAQEIPAHLDTQGAKLKGLSGQAFDVLEKEGQTFPVKDLQQAIADKMETLKIGGKVVPTVGPDASAYAVMGKFNDLLGEVGAKIGEDIPAPVVKELIQQLDGLSAESYSTNAGALSPVAAGRLAEVRYGFNQALRDASPAYATVMDQLAPQVGLVNDMSKVFGNEQSSMTALKAAADPMTPRGHVVRGMLDAYDKANGTDFAQRVTDYYDKPRAALQDAQAGLQAAKEAAEGVSKLGPNSTENVLKSVQGGRNIEARRQLEGLDPELAQTVSDTGVARQFAKATTNGSRKAVMGRGVGGAAGAGIGALVGGPVGAAVGGFVGQAAGGYAGGLADIYGGQAVKTALDAGIKLDKLANTPYIKPLMQAAQKSPKSLAIAHYMLDQTDPEYQKITNP